MRLAQKEKLVLSKLEYHVLENHNQGQTSSPVFEDGLMFSFFYEGPYTSEDPPGEIDENYICWHLYYAEEFKDAVLKDEPDGVGAREDTIYAWINVDEQRVDLVWDCFEEAEWSNIINNMYAYFLKHDNFDKVKSRK